MTDLGVDREYEGQGIGRSLMKKAHELAGGEKDIEKAMSVGSEIAAETLMHYGGF